MQMHSGFFFVVFVSIVFAGGLLAWNVGLFGGMDFNQQHVDPNCGNTTNSVSASMDLLRSSLGMKQKTTSDSKQQTFAGWDMPRWCPDEARHPTINFIPIYDSILHDGAYDLPWQKKNTRFGQPPQLEVKISPILRGETSPRVSCEILISVGSILTLPHFDLDSYTHRCHPNPSRRRFDDFPDPPEHWSDPNEHQSHPRPRKAALIQWSTSDPLKNCQHCLLFVASSDVRKFGGHLIWDCWRKLWFFMMYGIFVTSANIAGAVPSKMYITTIHPVSLLIVTARRKENVSLKVKNLHLFKGFCRHRIDSKFFDVSSTNVGPIFGKKKKTYVYIYMYIYIHFLQP